jgi:quercetin dioxygenase-like cupin family protein
VSDFAVKNLLEIEDSASAFGDGIQGRFARTYLDSQHLGVSLFHYAPGFRLAHGHAHREQEEAYIVIEGSGRAKLDGTIVELAQWDVLRVAPPVTRAFEGGPAGMTLIAVASAKPPEGDAIQSPGFWPAG